MKVSGSSRYSPAHGRRLALAATGAAGALAALSAFPTRALAFLGDENLIVIKVHSVVFLGLHDLEMDSTGRVRKPLSFSFTKQMGDEKGRLVFVPDYVKLEKGG